MKYYIFFIMLNFNLMDKNVNKSQNNYVNSQKFYIFLSKIDNYIILI
jgi:hypothetical protein